MIFSEGAFRETETNTGLFKKYTLEQATALIWELGGVEITRSAPIPIGRYAMLDCIYRSGASRFSRTSGRDPTSKQGRSSQSTSRGVVLSISLRGTALFRH